MRTTWIAARLAAAVLILVALVEPVITMAMDGTLEPSKYFGYFTIQSNIVAMVVIAVSIPRTGRPRPRWLELARAASSTYMVIVSTVYWTMLVGLVGDDAWGWTNLVCHGFTTAFMLADWLIEGPCERLPWRLAPTVLAYPALWLAAALVRGAAGGWVPYPFLETTDGYGPVAVVCGTIIVAGVAIALALFPLAQWRRLAPARET
ncbi:Pr6Pr family membrane protein [Demequina salsinemoris]|uniref:Pr6Pr family membrane protein n=1 Tax=Demequina salsinemoris TaxID=577470 RepID=UPI000780BB4D|nr:Pr6Pr family membrane protein [Demequina salsinemoris]